MGVPFNDKKTSAHDEDKTSAHGEDKASALGGDKASALGGKKPISIRNRGQWRDIAYRLSRNRLAMIGLVIVVLLLVMAVFADVIAPYHYAEQDMANRFSKLTLQHPFGTDNYGRDILSRIIYGARISLLTAFGAVCMSLLAGGILGLIAGFFGGIVETVIIRVIDIVQAIPGFLLAVAVQSVLGSGYFNTMLALAVSSIAPNTRILRAAVLSIRGQEFVRAARATGSRGWRIILKHILPNTIAPVLVNATLSIGGSILAISGLSFVGLGVGPPTAEWGAMLNAGRAYIRDYWQLITFPGISIMLTLFGFNVFGDGLRDALDPRLKR